MAYTALPATDVSNWDGQYNALNLQLAQQNNLQQAQTRQQMQTLASRAEQRLSRDIRLVRTYFQQHQNSLKTWLAQAEAEAKNARKLAADFKSHPQKTELIPQIKRSLGVLDAIHQQMKDDAADYGRAWFDYRTYDLVHIPSQHIKDFKVVRATLMNSQKPTLVTFEKVKALRREVESLLGVTDKAKMKAAMRDEENPTAQRPIGDAQRLAQDAAALIRKTLTDLQAPKGTLPKPNASGNAVTSLTNMTNSRLFSKQDLVSARGTLANAETSVGMMKTKLASMVKLHGNAKKSLRSNELTDTVVKAQLTQAAQDIKTAQTAVKTSESDFKKAKTAFSKYESAWRKANP